MPYIGSTDLLALAACLDSARRKGVLALLDAEQTGVDVESAAERLGLAPRSLEQVLLVLLSAGVTEQVDSKFRLSSDWRETSSRWPAGLLGQCAVLDRIEPFLNGDTAQVSWASSAAEHYRGTAPRMGSLFHDHARRLHEHLTREHTDVRLVVDIGAGSGVWSAPFMGQSSARRILVDLEGVTPLELEGSSSSVVAGLGEALPIIDSCADVVIAGNVLHVACVDLDAVMREASRVARPGGLIAVIDAFAVPGIDELGLRLYDLHLQLRGAGALIPVQVVDRTAALNDLVPKSRVIVSPRRKLHTALVFQKPPVVV